MVSDLKPAKRLAVYGHVFAFSKIENRTSRCILDTLEALQERRRKIKIERIAVVEVRKN
jgi:hypothetical protein